MAASRQRLLEGCQSGDYYESLIFYKSALSRKMNNKSKAAEAFTMILDGVKTAWECAAADSADAKPHVAPAAIDIGGQVVNLWEIHDRTASVEGIQIIISQLKELFSAMPRGPISSTTGLPAGSAEKSELFTTFLKWVGGQKTSITSRPGEPLKEEHLDALKQLQAEASALAGRAYEEAGETRKAYSHLLNSFPLVTGTAFVELVLAGAKSTTNVNESAAWLYRGVLHILLRPSADFQTLNGSCQMLLNVAATKGHPLIKLGQALISLIILSNKANDDAKATSRAPFQAVGDQLYASNKEKLLEKIDTHLAELTIIVLQRYDLTEKNKKVDAGGMGGMLGNIMSMLSGGNQ